MVRSGVMVRLLCGLALAGLLGCSGTAGRQSDPNIARQTLADALEGWKGGQAHEEYKKAHPSVTVVDKQWQGGYKLASYEFDGEPQQDGYDLQFKVKMLVHDPAGKQSKQKAVYNVSTSPALVIVRIEPGGGG